MRASSGSVVNDAPLFLFTCLRNVAQNSLMTPILKLLAIQQAPHVCYSRRWVGSALGHFNDYLSLANDLSASLGYAPLRLLEFFCKLINAAHSANASAASCRS